MPSDLPSAGRFLGGVALPVGAAAASQDPVDVATMFAKLRNALPMGLAAYAPELNKGEAEWIAQRNRERDWEEAQRVNRRELTPEEQMRNFEWQYPGQIERQLMLEYLRRQQERQLPGPRRAPPAQPFAQQEARAIEPRRKADGGIVKQSAADVNVPPEGAQAFMDAIRKKFNVGGAIGLETTPDMRDGGRIIPVPQIGMSGGGDPGKKLKAAASMFKTLEKEPDLARRAFFKLPESPNLPSVIEKQALPGMKNAPKVVEKTVELSPGEGAKKVTLKSLAETPVSRREVLQSAASQVARRVLPNIEGAAATRIVPEELFAGTSDWPSVYEAMLPMVAKYAPQEVKTLPERVGVTLEDLLRGSDEDPFVRSMPENIARFRELFPETYQKVIGKASGGVVTSADMSRLVSNVMANGVSEPEAIRMLAPIFTK